jgi:preprotein translocase subunit SecD
MLRFTRLQTAAILVTVVVLCGFAVPNFVSDETLTGWPPWAQRRIALAPELQGGMSQLFEINNVREYVLDSLLGEVRGVLHDARINLAYSGIRNGSVQVRPVAHDFEAALAKLRELSRPFNGVRTVEVTDAGGGLISVAPTEAAVREYEPPIVDDAIRTIRARLFLVPATVEREGANRLRVQVPGLEPAEVYSRVITP